MSNNDCASGGADVRDPWAGSPFPPRKWQAEALPIIIEAMKRRERGIVSAVMGGGKSILQSALVANALPRLGGRAIVVTVPRQALVRQLAATMRSWMGEDTVGVFYGRKKQAERRVIVACNASLPRLWEQLQEWGRSVALMVCDEAHGTQGETLRTLIPQIAPTCLVGFTATPFRSVPSETIETFDRVLYRYTMADAERDGVLVHMRHERLEGRWDGSVDEACLQLMEQHARGPGIVSAASIEDAEEHAQWLTSRGWTAAAIHSGHSEAERARLLDALRAGEYRALVHVSLLAEGVDFPWLRWLCLRRNVSARVRFLQEIGRVLRVDREPDPKLGPKVEGVVLDPHLLLGRHGLTTIEAIGQALEDAAEEEARDDQRQGRKGEPTEAEAVALDELLEYLERVRESLEDGGVLDSSEVRRGGWRLASASEKQVEAVKKASRLTRHVPGEHREAIKTLVKVPYALTKGQASDLLDVLYGGSKWARAQMEEDPRLQYPSQVQWDADLVAAVPPEHSACLAAGRGGRKAAPK